MTTKVTEKNISSVANRFIQWQSVKTSGFTAVAGQGYFCNTTSAAFTVTLPASPIIGDTILLKDYAGTFATNNLTIGRNGNNIQGVAGNATISTNRASLVLVYVDATRGWEFTVESNTAVLTSPLFTSATGGTVTTSGNFKIHSFTGDGCFVVSQLGNSPTIPTGGPANVDYLVIAGGGGGGCGCGLGGGGGAGGYRTSFPSPACNAGSFPITATTYAITVGGGGNAGGAGNASIFSTITSAAGGKGGSYNNPAGNGGSGGGGQAAACITSPGGTGNTPPVSPSQGNNGGSGTNSGSSYGAGGGGGAGATGTNGTTAQGGPGGSGLANLITASPVTYSGGGGGGTGAASPGPAGGTGGPGGGGNGSKGGNAATSTTGTANTGGGGGGGGSGAGKAGGKGIVIIRYKFQ